MQGSRGISRQAFGAGEFGHDQSAAAQRTNYAAEDGVGDSSHRRQNRGGPNNSIANFDFNRKHVGSLFYGSAFGGKSCSGTGSPGGSRNLCRPQGAYGSPGKPRTE